MSKRILRPARLIGNLFVLIILLIISSMYYVYVFHAWGPQMMTNVWAKASLIGFHFFLFMLLWSFLQTIITDPGRVPIYWGFYMGDSEQKRRRYCLMCNVFKPERCHHCSACNRCVLNMDHHCPWVNNCIGFWNRKHFMLLLFYTLALIYYILLTMIKPFYDTIIWHMNVVYEEATLEQWVRIGLIETIFIFDLFLTFLMTFFVKFHFMLVLYNITTLESLEHKGIKFTSQFDIGKRINWEQVFGGNPFLWLFPLFGTSGNPVGNGVTWPQRGGRQLNYEEPMLSDELGESNRESIERKSISRGMHSSIKLTEGKHGNPKQSTYLSNPIVAQGGTADFQQTIKKGAYSGTQSSTKPTNVVSSIGGGAKGPANKEGYYQFEDEENPNSQNKSAEVQIIGLNEVQVHEQPPSYPGGRIGGGVGQNTSFERNMQQKPGGISNVVTMPKRRSPGTQTPTPPEQS